MRHFAEYNKYPELRNAIVEAILRGATKSHGNENLYPRHFQDDFKVRLKKEIATRISEHTLQEAIREYILMPENFVAQLELKKYYLVMPSKDKEEVWRDTQFYMSKLYQPFINKYGNEDEAEFQYQLFHNYFVIPTSIIYERHLRTFLEVFLRDNIKIYSSMNNKVIELPDFIDNIHQMTLLNIKWAMENIMELFWVLLYVDEFNVTLFDIPPGTPSLN